MDNKIVSVLVIICAIVLIAGIATGNTNINNNANVNLQSNSIQSSNNQLVTISEPIHTAVSTSKATSDHNQGQALSLENVIKLFNNYVESTFKKSGVPGAAIVIVKNQKIVYMNCLGFRNLATKSPVTPNTLFEIGSCTKAFSATNVAQQVDNGLMKWNDPIIKYFNPALFKLYSPSASKLITIRDALCHRSGLPSYAGDTQWSIFNETYVPMMYKLRYIKNDTAFRSTYNYNNIIYALGGYSAARVHNTAWYSLIKKELLNPLGMHTATTRYVDFLKTPNHATSYQYLSNGHIIPAHVSNLDGVGPAGSMGCSVKNMANWLKFQIADTGKYNGIRIVSKKNLDQTRSGQIMTSSPDHDEVYCLGWERIINTNPYKDRIYHGGDTLYSKTFTEIFPYKKLGLVIMVNAGQYGQGLRDALGKKFNDLFKGTYFTNPWPQFKELNKPIKIPDPTPPITKPKALTTYTGTYYNPLYGNMKIVTKQDSLFVYYGHNKHPYKLYHWNNNTFNDPIHTNEIDFTNIYKGKSHQFTTYFQDYSTVPAGATSKFKRIKQK